MFFRTLVFYMLLGLGVLSVLASRIDTPAADTEELVLTPAGLMPKSNVHLVPKGARIHHTPTKVQLIGADGTILHSAPISQTNTPHFASTPTQDNVPRALQTGAVCFAVWEDTTSSPISAFNATWVVPIFPNNFDGQTIFYTSALQPSLSPAIVLQPALQFGVSSAGGGDFYGIASWFITGTTVFHSQLTEVQPFQLLAATMTLSLVNPGQTFNWGAGFVTFENSQIALTTADEFLFAFQGLQIFAASSINDIGQVPTDIVDIAIQTLNGDLADQELDWKVTSDVADRITMTVVSTSATEGELLVTIP